MIWIFIATVDNTEPFLYHTLNAKASEIMLSHDVMMMMMAHDAIFFYHKLNQTLTKKLRACKYSMFTII